ncbi:hypothetical protein ACFSSA_03120 [Luteolibacter algae]|uniref:Uncharacterized protein n=1 Tax=Luteolibacter algae TaxID=454151 RepID=A0ABW5D7K7_9BACT
MSYIQRSGSFTDGSQFTQSLVLKEGSIENPRKEENDRGSFNMPAP